MRVPGRCRRITPTRRAATITTIAAILLLLAIIVLAVFAAAWYLVRFQSVRQGMFEVTTFDQTSVRHFDDGTVEAEWTLVCRVGRPSQFSIRVEPEDQSYVLDMQTGVITPPRSETKRRSKTLGSVTAERAFCLFPYRVSLHIKYNRGVVEVIDTLNNDVVGHCDLNAQFGIHKWVPIAKSGAGSQSSDRGVSENVLVFRGTAQKDDDQPDFDVSVALEIECEEGTGK